MERGWIFRVDWCRYQGSIYLYLFCRNYVNYEITKYTVSRCCFVLNVYIVVRLLGIVYYIIYQAEEIESLIIAVECCILGYIESVNFSQVSIQFSTLELLFSHSLGLTFSLLCSSLQEYRVFFIVNWKLLSHESLSLFNFFLGKQEVEAQRWPKCSHLMNKGKFLLSANIMLV